MKLYADCANTTEIARIIQYHQIKGITTNPTLMKAEGITDYQAFAQSLLTKINTERPDINVSLEVFADDFDEMYRQAKLINSWTSNPDSVYIKIPVTNTKGESSLPLVNKLTSEGIRVNITAILSYDQIIEVLSTIDLKQPTIISIFAGRIADTFRDPCHIIAKAINFYSVNYLHVDNRFELLWASTREIVNYLYALEIGCSIVTMPVPMIDKMFKLHSKNLDEYSLETVKQFRQDAIDSGFKI